ncbi:MAG: hypothetical protein ACP5O1_10595 [Phycisphaerae bacterium]
MGNKTIFTGLAAGLAVLLLASAAYFIGQHRGAGFSDLIVADFDRSQHIIPAVDVASGDPGIVGHWLRVHTKIPVALPRLVQSQWRLLGGHICRLHGRTAAEAVYKNHGAVAALLVMPNTTRRRLGLSQSKISSLGFWQDRCKGENLVVQQHGTVTYLAVSTLPGRALMSLIREGHNQGGGFR